MSVDIKTAGITPVRQTFSHVARRLGGDKPASRYQEATFDLQPDCNFHYRPLWDPDRELYDRQRTAIVMADWYAFKDPRQFYYGAYVLNRARQQETAESNFTFAAKHGLVSSLPDRVNELGRDILLPLRHLEYAANLNNCAISAYGWGSAITQCTTYTMMDRLGIAQYLSRIGLLIDGNTGTSLKQAKQLWLNDPAWQPLRRLAEDTLVIEDWFELFVAQNLIIDGLVYPLAYDHLCAELARDGGAVVTMLTEFMSNWYAESQRWIDAFIKTAAAESPENKALLTEWAAKWRSRTTEALAPLVKRMGLADGPAAFEQVDAGLGQRLSKLGIAA